MKKNSFIRVLTSRWTVLLSAIIIIIFIIINIFTFIFIWLYAKLFGGKKQFEHDLDRVRADFDKYLKEQERAKIAKQADRLRAAQIEGAKHPQCPNCKSLQTKRITTTNRAASVAMVGLASDKIGKQFECPVCKYKW